MFKVSQEIRLNSGPSRGSSGGGNSTGRHSYYNNRDSVIACGSGSNSSVNCSSSGEGGCGNASIFGRYQKTPDADAYPADERSVFVAPELTDPSKVELLHLPRGAIRQNSDIHFVIKRNDVKGNFEVRLESPAGNFRAVPLQILDPQRLRAQCHLPEAGMYKLHVKCNSVPLPKSPFIVISICGTEPEAGTSPKPIELPDFHSDATKVTHTGLGLQHICLNERNEFTVDGSAAGNNILFVGIFGPDGPCDEVVIKHLGRNIYKVTYGVHKPGEYLIVVKFGDDHITGSPFTLVASD